MNRPHKPYTVEIPHHWSPEQALRVFEWFHAIAYAIWDAYDDELLDAIEDRCTADDRQLDLPF
jgi:hypothetical protein